MNDLNNKSETNLEEHEPSGEATYTSEGVYYKKLGAYLLLLYQGYLKKETHLEADIKMALLRMVLFNQGYALKIRMMQRDYLNREFPILDGEWDEGSDILFPIDESEPLKPESDQMAKTFKEYKKTVSALLRSAL